MPNMSYAKFLVKDGENKKGDVVYLPVPLIRELGDKVVEVSPAEAEPKPEPAPKPKAKQK